MQDDSEYHLERAAMEDSRAEGAIPEVARAHRELADLHRARSASFRLIERLSTRKINVPAVKVDRTDKEG